MRLHIIKANNLIKNRVVSLVSLSTWYEKSISIHNPSSLQFRIRSWSAVTLSFKSLSRAVYTREGNRQVFFFFFSSNHRHEIFRRSTKRQQRYRFNRVFTSPSPLLFFLLPSSFFLSFFFSSLSPLPSPPPFYRLSLPHRRIPRSLARASACSTRSCTVSRGLVLALMSDDKGFQR